MSHGQFEYLVNGSPLHTDDEIVGGRQVRIAAGLVPPSSFILIRTDGGIAQSMGLEENVRLKIGAPAIFRAFETDRVFTFTVDERGWEWGAPEIEEEEIRRIAGIADDHELFLDSDHDRAIPRGGSVRLSGGGVEHVRSRLIAPRSVRIIVNGRERRVEAGIISFEQLVAIAFPEPPTGQQVLFTVSYRKGPNERPEGSLLPGQTVHVRNGMIFNVTATDKS